MAFEATKQEWSEFYVFLRLLGEGRVFLGDRKGKKFRSVFWPITYVEREEYRGTRRYYVEGENIRMVREKEETTIPKIEFLNLAQQILEAIEGTPSDPVSSPIEVEAFMRKYEILDLQAETQDRTDLAISFWNPRKRADGFIVRSRLGAMQPLLAGGRAANIKYQLTANRFSVPTVENINAIESNNTVRDRMLRIEELGGKLKYDEVADKVFRSNLQMFDGQMGRILGEMARFMHLKEIAKVSELVAEIEESNPLKISHELLVKHQYYRFKVKQFLYACALGMRPAKIYRGNDSAIQGMIFVGADGVPICYHQSEEELFMEFLFTNTRLERGILERDKHGSLDRDHGEYFFRLNIQVGLTKK